MDFEKMMEIYYNDPVAFSYDFLGFKCDENQELIMNSVCKNKRTAVSSGQGIGKSATVSCLIIWYLITRYNSKIMCTAPNITQLNTVLWSEVAKWLDGSFLTRYLTQTKTRLYVNGFEKTWFAFPKTATTKEGLAGQHAEHLFCIADEASGIKDDILETLQGTITGAENKLLFISNPTRKTGVFFHAFHENRDNYNCIKINSEKSIFVNKENIQMLEKSYGRDSDVYRIRVLGEFPTNDGGDIFINKTIVEKNIFNPPKINTKQNLCDIIIGVDVARYGDDKTVITIKADNVVYPLLKLSKKSLTTTAGIVTNLCNDLVKKNPETRITVVIDEIGIGSGVLDILVENKKTGNLTATDNLAILGCNASRAPKTGKYYDLTTLLMGKLKTALMEESLTIPNDEELINEITTRKYEVLSNGKIKIESKKDMKKRGFNSPDSLDSLCLTMFVNSDVKPRRRVKK